MAPRTRRSCRALSRSSSTIRDDLDMQNGTKMRTNEMTRPTTAAARPAKTSSSGESGTVVLPRGMYLSPFMMARFCNASAASGANTEGPSRIGNAQAHKALDSINNTPERAVCANVAMVDKTVSNGLLKGKLVAK